MGCLTSNKPVTLGADQDYLVEFLLLWYVASFKNFAGSVALVICTY